MQELTVAGTVQVELFRGIRTAQNVLPVSPLDGYKYSTDEVQKLSMNEADEETGNNAIYFFTVAQRKRSNTLG